MVALTVGKNTWRESGVISSLNLKHVHKFKYSFSHQALLTLGPQAVGLSMVNKKALALVFRDYNEAERENYRKDSMDACMIFIKRTVGN